MLNSLFYLYNRLCHFILAKPIDILHSPFVFQLYQSSAAIQKKALFESMNISHLKQDGFSNSKALASILSALNSKEIFTLKQINQNWILEEWQTKLQIPFEKEKQPIQIDALLIDNSIDLTRLPLAELKTCLQAKQPILINQPHLNKVSRKQWQSLCKQTEVQVAIDFFAFGLCFFNRKQAKEYFKLRLW